MARHMFEDECSVVRKGNCGERGEVGHRGLRDKGRFSAPNKTLFGWRNVLTYANYFDRPLKGTLDSQR